MSSVNRLYQHINILSLDVVVGSLIGALFFAKLFETQVISLVLVALALTVWLIYTIDHLRDAWSIKAPASTDRHRFHQRHFKVISIVVVVVLAIDGVIVFLLPAEVLRAGLALGIIVFLYLIFQRYLKFLKEIFVASLYTAGVVLPSFSTVSAMISPIHYLVIAKFAITALMNLLLFSLFDLKDDRTQQQHSFVTWFGAKYTSYGIVFLGLLNVCSGIWLWKTDAALAGVFILMNMLLLAILVFRRNLAHNNYYRILGDAAFFIPAFYLL
ncbi:MAG TPA: hypothetical protein VFT90_11235 [Chryseosolibacter sp.]|nr:hypothetical protein [Chryseosolibacter sp.]